MRPRLPPQRWAGPHRDACDARDLCILAKDRAVIVRDLLAVRRQLARATLERLVESADDAALRNVEAAIDRFAVVADADAPADQLAAADLEVVAALVAATGSAVLQLCFNPVAALLRELPIFKR